MANLGLRNSLVPINLLPLDVLLLIPTHLTSLSDRLRVTFVCHHWRQAFVQHGPLWSKLHLSSWTDRDLLAKLLERAKQSPLNISLYYFGSELNRCVSLLSPFAKQIKNLTAHDARGDGIPNLSAVMSGSLPLLHTLTIEDFEGDANSHSIPTSPLFKGATNMKKFVLKASSSLPLSCFTFPNLTTFNFRTLNESETFPALLLLNFLEASPLLEEIDMGIANDISYEGVPPDRVLVLPFVKHFHLIIANNRFNWELPTYLSCPSAERTSFERRLGLTFAGRKIPKDIYPSSLPWTAIVRQYTAGTVDRVVLKFFADDEVTCRISFYSSNQTSLQLFYPHSIGKDGCRDVILDACDLFSQACRTIRDHPLLKNVRILCIRGGELPAENLKLSANDVGKLFGSLGPLEELILDDCDLRPYLDPFFETPLFPDAIQPISFPPIKKFSIIIPMESLCGNETHATAVVKLANSQHARGMPFEVVVLRPPAPSWVVEQLMLSVNTVVCDEAPSDGDEDRY